MMDLAHLRIAGAVAIASGLNVAVYAFDRWPRSWASWGEPLSVIGGLALFAGFMFLVGRARSRREQSAMLAIFVAGAMVAALVLPFAS